MKVLILSCNTGAGHNACAGAVQEAMAARGIPCDIVDGLSFVSKAVSRVISGAHVCLYRSFPRLYGMGYSLAEKRSKPGGNDSLMFRFLGLGSKSLRAHIAAGAYTHVICTHLFPAMMLTRMQRTSPLPITTAFISTDYTASPGYEAIAVDWCFIPAPQLIPEFEKSGLPTDHIVSCGIPVRREYQSPADRAASRQALGIDPEHRHLLVMSGSMGCGPLNRVMALLTEALADDVDISVICGTNRKLLRQLNRRFDDKANVHVHDYVERIGLYMDSADLYLTKPGGLSVSEALSKRLPMVLLQTVDGCETYNMRYCLERGAAVSAHTAEDVAALCVSLIRDGAALEGMRENMRGVFEKPAAEVVCDCLLTNGDRG